MKKIKTKNISMTIPSDIYSVVKDMAEKNDRSFSSQVTQILREATKSLRMGATKNDLTSRGTLLPTSVEASD